MSGAMFLWASLSSSRHAHHGSRCVDNCDIFFPDLFLELSSNKSHIGAAKRQADETINFGSGDYFTGVFP